MRKLNTLTLCGLMIGPILGSGIIILPPVTYEVAGNWALPAWVLIILLGFAFAAVFGALSILFPGDSGVTQAVESAFGPGMKRLTAYYLIGAVLFGPVAVLLTAADYFPLDLGFDRISLSFGVMLLCVFLMLRQISSVGKVSLVMSTLAAGTLLVGSVTTLLSPENQPPTLGAFEPISFGQALLLLFWTIIGWEVVGNYSADVNDPTRSIPRAVGISALAIAGVSLLVAAAYQSVASTGAIEGYTGVSVLLAHLAGEQSGQLLGLLVFFLCTTTYLLFVGGVARLMSSLSVDGALPCLLSKRLDNRAPVGSILILGLINGGVLISVQLGWFDIKGLVALADGFFLANAIIGLATAVKLLRSPALRWSAGLLIICLSIILTFSHWPVLMVLGAMALATLRGGRSVASEAPPV